MTDAINDVDEEAAARRVQRLAKARPGASTEELVEVLVKQKCMQTGAVGLITSGAAAVPGLGTLVALTFGVAADIAWTFKLQAELVLEIAALYKHRLGPADKRNTVLLVTGISAGANQVLRKAGQRIAEEVSERLAERVDHQSHPRDRRGRFGREQHPVHLRHWPTRPGLLQPWPCGGRRLGREPHLIGSRLGPAG